MNTRRKNIIFSLLPTLGVIGVLVLGEIALRVFSPNPNGEPVLDLSFDGIEWHQVNRAYLAKYFPPGAPAVPEFKPSLFFRDKPPGLFRVICLGGSSMFGTPYIMSGTIPAIVRKQLRHLAPDQTVEVINWSATAINSNVVRDLAGEILRFEPDLVLIYLGHNEFYGPDGVGANFLERWIPFLTPLKYNLRELRLVQVLQGFLAGEPPQGAKVNLMRQVSGSSLVPLDSDDSRRIFGRFEKNLRAIVETFRSRSIPVILSEVSSNLMFPPFVSDSSVAASTQEALVRAEHLVANDSARSALVALASIPPADSLAAAAQYWKGRALLALGRQEDAVRALRLARDLDLLKFRAPSAINTIIRRVAGEEHLPCVPADSLLGELSGGIPGDEMFWEHLHLKNEGYAAVARLFVQAIIDQKLIETSQQKLLPYDIDSLSICWLDRAYADISIRHLTGRWPFQHYHRQSVVLDLSPQALQDVAQATYARELTWDEGCYKTATYFWAHRKFREARTTYEALLEEYPYGFYPNYLMGSLLNHIGRTAEAVPYYQRSIRSNPEFPRARLDMALIGINAGRAEEGIRELTAVLALLPAEGQGQVRATVYYGLAAAYANLGDLNRGLSYVDQALTLAPDYREAVRLRAQMIAAAER
jgi:tetratricopeptide (TPR) repeat protein